MKSLEEASLNFYDAVMKNNGPEILAILNHNTQIPIRTITGMLVIAIEHKAQDSIKAILTFNQQSNNKIPETALNSLLKFAAKEDLLKEITCH